MTSKSLFSLCKLLLWMAAVVGCTVNPPRPESFDADLENTLGLTFSPDGKTAYWTGWNGKWGANGTSPRQIFFSDYQDGRWSAAAAMPFTTSFNDDDPFVSLDGRWLYFVSDRPTSVTDAVHDSNIWRYKLGSEDQLEQVAVNSIASEYSPVVTTAVLSTLHRIASAESAQAIFIGPNLQWMGTKCRDHSVAQLTQDTASGISGYPQMKKRSSSKRRPEPQMYPYPATFTIAGALQPAGPTRFRLRHSTQQIAISCHACIRTASLSTTRLHQSVDRPEY